MPEVIRISVDKILKRVVFPLPFGPRSPKISPHETLKLTLSSARRSGYAWERFSTSSLFSTFKDGAVRNRAHKEFEDFVCLSYLSFSVKSCVTVPPASTVTVTGASLFVPHASCQ